jgi:hypothetical protein
LPSAVRGFAAGVGVTLGTGLGVGVAVGLGVGVTLGTGVGVGEVNVFPSNEPGFVELGATGVALVAFELKAIHLPSALITGLTFAISTRTFENTNAVILGS